MERAEATDRRSRSPAAAASGYCLRRPLESEGPTLRDVRTICTQRARSIDDLYTDWREPIDALHSNVVTVAGRNVPEFVLPRVSTTGHGGTP